MADSEKRGFDNASMAGDNPAMSRLPAGYGQPQQYGVTSDPYAYSQPQGPPPYVTQPGVTSPYVSTGHPQYGPPVIVTTQPVRETGTPPETGCSLAVSIISIFLCLGAWPFAVVAIVFNRKAHSLVQQGQYTAARGSIRTMYIFLAVTFVLGIIAWVIAGIRIKYTLDAINEHEEYYYGK